MNYSGIDKECDMPEDKDIINMPSCRYKSMLASPMPSGGIRYIAPISEPIFDADDYYQLIYVLNSATEKDEVVIKLASPGGSIEIGIMICNAMFNSKAKVITQVTGIAASIAAVIWCCGKQKSISPTATLMFHMPSGFAGGKTADMEEQAGFFQNYFKDLLKKITTNVLTEDEYNDMVNGRRDIFISYNDLKDRLVRKGV